ncbi:MAG: hypothetical protein Q4D56_14045, partial [Bacteroides sp.]|nr:hypothetical protein [Bacteroides sp.]
ATWQRGKYGNGTTASLVSHVVELLGLRDRCTALSILTTKAVNFVTIQKIQVFSSHLGKGCAVPGKKSTDFYPIQHIVSA